MRIINLCLILSLFVLISCKDNLAGSRREGGSVVGNGGTSPGPTIETNGITYNISQLSTIFFDVSDEVIRTCLDQQRRGFVQEDAFSVDGQHGGKAILSPLSNEERDVNKFRIIFDKLNMRRGFPVFDQGKIETDLVYSLEKINGGIKGDKVKIGNNLIDFEIYYNLRLRNSIWKGTMKGKIRIDGRDYIIFHNYDAPFISSVSLSTRYIYDAGDIVLKINVNSNSPVSFFHAYLRFPNKDIIGGGENIEFVQIDEGVWQYQLHEHIFEYMPSGIYRFCQIFVENKAHLRSMVYPNQYFRVSRESFNANN